MEEKHATTIAHQVGTAVDFGDRNEPRFLLSTVRAGIEVMGGRLELVAVFDDEHIAIETAPLGPQASR